jgi:hypothetical protein
MARYLVFLDLLGVEVVMFSLEKLVSEATQIRGLLQVKAKFMYVFTGFG